MRRCFGVPETTEEEQKPEVKTFTQEQVNALLATEKRKAAEKFADYDAVKEKASRLDQLEQDSKTELQKALDEAAALKSKVEKFERQAQVNTWADEITKDSDIPASVLRGETREELEKHFEQLQALAPKPKRTPAPSGKSAGDGGGSRAVAALRQLGFGSDN
jgi:hypothetical protein